MTQSVGGMKHLTRWIFIALVLGVLLGSLVHGFKGSGLYITSHDVTSLVGQIFINLLKMLVVPIVLVSLVVGTLQLKASSALGRYALKSIILYLLTTAVAVLIALVVANLFHIGVGAHMKPTHFVPKDVPTLSSVILNIFPSNPIQSLFHANMLQIIVFSLLLGAAISMAGKHAEPVVTLFKSLHDVMMKLVTIVLYVAPFGVFCLVFAVFLKEGFNLLHDLAGYFFTVLFVLFLHWFFVYGSLVKFMAKERPLKFFKNMLSAMFFAFSTASSNASIPVTLQTAEEKLKVRNSVAAFVIPLGATINMDGTAIMQGVATVFIAHLFGVHLSVGIYLTIILMATLASIGTAGVPGVGLITLAMVLQQAGLPIEGIGLIIGVDRLLDMVRTAVNISGDCAVALYVSRSEKEHLS